MSNDIELPIVLLHGTMGKFRGLVTSRGEAVWLSLGDSPKLHRASRWKELDQCTRDKRSRG